MADESTQQRIERAKAEVAASPEADDVQEIPPRPDAAKDPVGAALPPGAPDGVHAAANGDADLSGEDEHDAVFWLLQPQRSLRYRVPVQFETPQGPQPLLFVIRQLDSNRIDEIEKRHMNEATGRLRQLPANAEIVAEALVELRAGNAATRVDPASEEFRAGVPSKAIALEQRFHYQAGILAGVAGEVRRVAGWNPDRVGAAQRVLVEAAGN